MTFKLEFFLACQFTLTLFRRCQSLPLFICEICPYTNFKHISQIMWHCAVPLRHLSYLFRLIFTVFHSFSLFLLVLSYFSLSSLFSMTKSNALSIASPRCNLQVYQLPLNLIGFCCDYAVLMHKATHATARRTSVNWLKPTTSSATAVYTFSRSYNRGL